MAILHRETYNKNVKQIFITKKSAQQTFLTFSPLLSLKHPECRGWGNVHDVRHS